VTTISLPDALARRLAEEAKRRGVSLEELVLDELSELMDPAERSRAYWEAAERLLAQAEGELAGGDLRQASEKIWGAAALAVKAVAWAREGRRLASHGELWSFVDELARKAGDEAIRDGWRAATAMHVNYYEGWAPEGEVRSCLERVRDLLGRLRGLLP